MPEPGGAEIDTGAKISKTTAVEYAKKALKFASKHKIKSVPVNNNVGTANKADFELLNAGLGLRDTTKREQRAAKAAGKQSFEERSKTIPVTPEMTNSVDFDPVPEISDHIQKSIEAIDEKIANETPDNPLSPHERERLDRLRDALGQAELKPIPSFQTKDGDFVRDVPDTQEYEYVDANGEKQVFRFVIRNWDETKIREGQTVTVSLPTYNTRVDEGSSAQARDSRLALQMPDTPMISIMYPGMGSDPLTPEQIEQLKGSQDFSDISRRMLSLLDSMGVKSINAIGASMGYSALFLGAEAVDFDLKDGGKMKVNKVVVAATPPGNTTVNELRKAEKKEASKLDAAMSGPFEPFGFKSTDLDKNWLMRKLGLARWVGRSVRADPIWKGSPYQQSMAQYSAKELISKFLKANNDTTFEVITGTEDGVGSTQAWNATLKELEAEDETFAAKMSHSVYSGASHVFYENPSRFAGMMERALRN